MSGSGGALPSLALFCATACLYRQLALRRDGVHDQARGNPRHVDGADEELDLVLHSTVRKRVSFDQNDALGLAAGPADPDEKRSWCSPELCLTTGHESTTDLHKAQCNWSHFEMNDGESKSRRRSPADTTAAAAAAAPTTARLAESGAMQQPCAICEGVEMGEKPPENGAKKTGVLMDELDGVCYKDNETESEEEAEETRLPQRIKDFFARKSSDISNAESDAEPAILPSLGRMSYVANPSDHFYNPRDEDDELPLHLSSLSRQSSCPLPRDAPSKKPPRRLESARADYNAKIMPNKVIMVRHGQSEGNTEENLYATTPDNAVRLTQLGWEQARMAGRELRQQVLERDESVHFVISPYVRTMETFHGIVSAWCDPSEFDHIEGDKEKLKAWYLRLMEMGLTWHEDPRIREQDFGNYQDPATIQRCKKERHKFGAFYYRFPHGESGADVYDRVSTFLDSLWRSFDLKRSQNYVLVTHGIAIRVLLARYFRYSIDQFNLLSNPKNCDMVILGHDGAGKLRLEGRYELELKDVHSKDEEGREGKEVNPPTPSKQVVGYNFHHTLRTFPRKYMKKREIRLSYECKG